MTGRRLHIGGLIKTPGWEVFNVTPGAHVDHLGDAKDFSRFENNTFSEIYASHVLEHFDYNKELSLVLKEWHRVLSPKGKIYVGVPDLETLCKLFLLKEHLSFEDRFYIMRVMFGGHMDKYDYHIVGLDEQILGQYLLQAGFINIKRVEKFNLFSDTSNLMFKDIPLSLNLIAEKI